MKWADSPCVVQRHANMSCSWGPYALNCASTDPPTHFACAKMMLLFMHLEQLLQIIAPLAARISRTVPDVERYQHSFSWLVDCCLLCIGFTRRVCLRSIGTANINNCSHHGNAFCFSLEHSLHNLYLDFVHQGACTHRKYVQKATAEEEDSMPKRWHIRSK